MTAKEKAKSIYNNYYNVVNDSMDILKIKTENQAYNCALIAVDEILEIFDGENTYWQEVKKELELL